MSVRTAQASARYRACEIIAYYLKHHDSIVLSFEKTCYYEWAIKEALREIKLSDDTPLNVLDRMLVKYDARAHTHADSADAFKVAATAIDDLIDLLITS